MIPEAMTALSSAADALRVLATISKMVTNSEAKIAIAELQVQLATINTTVAELIDENTKLKAQLAATAEHESLVLKDGMYYTQQGDGPFCTTCFDVRKQKVLLTCLPRHQRQLVGTHKCNACPAKYGARQ